MTADLPFLDFTAPGFSTRSKDLYKARAESWVAKTPYGLAVLRHSQAGQLIRDRRLRQGSYAWTKRNGLTGSFARFWESSVISQEGTDHKAMRAILTKSLSTDFVDELKPSFRQIAIDLSFPLIEKRECEFMADFSTPFAGMANCILLGLDLDHWPEISSDASCLGLAMGVECKSHETEFNAACDRLMNLAQELANRARRDPKDDSFTARLTHNFDQSDLTDEQILLDLIVIAIFGGVDTTRGQLGLLMHLFCQHPDQWRALVQDQSLADAAIMEAVRTHPTTTWATRESNEDFEFEGIDIPKGTTLHILSHSTATDPKIYDGHFDITTQRRIHFGFGGGSHHCVGHYLARSDMAQALAVLAQTFPKLALNGKPRFLPDSGNTAPITMPLSFR